MASPDAAIEVTGMPAIGHIILLSPSSVELRPDLRAAVRRRKLDQADREDTCLGK